jgi:hypothetical protein
LLVPPIGSISGVRVPVMPVLGRPGARNRRPTGRGCAATVRTTRTPDLRADLMPPPRASLPVGPDPDHVTEEEDGSITARLQEAITVRADARIGGTC